MLSNFPIGSDRLLAVYTSRKEVVESERHYNFSLNKRVKQTKDRQSGYEVEFVCSDSCGYRMRYHAIRRRSSTGKREATGQWRCSSGAKGFQACFSHNEFCMSSAKIGPKELAKMPHIISASTATTMRRPTVKELQVSTLLTCEVTASTYSVREAVAINQRQSHMFACNVKGTIKISMLV
jgi:hypothetical protein